MPPGACRRPTPHFALGFQDREGNAVGRQAAGRDRDNTQQLGNARRIAWQPENQAAIAFESQPGPLCVTVLPGRPDITRQRRVARANPDGAARDAKVCAFNGRERPRVLLTDQSQPNHRGSTGAGRQLRALPERSNFRARCLCAGRRRPSLHRSPASARGVFRGPWMRRSARGRQSP